jgi:hypothetical protein
VPLNSAQIATEWILISGGISVGSRLGGKSQVSDDGGEKNQCSKFVVVIGSEWFNSSTNGATAVRCNC